VVCLALCRFICFEVWPSDRPSHDEEWNPLTEAQLLILLAIFSFFTAILLSGEGLTRLAGLAYRQHGLLAMTMAARNATLIPVFIALASPDQPLSLVVLLIGMLVELAHLIGLKQLLLRQRWRRKALIGAKGAYIGSP